MSKDFHYDLAVLGGGPAGTRAALRAATAGLHCALIEPYFLGGTCLNVGCVPTKYLLGATASLPLASVQKKYKTLQGDLHVNLEALQVRKSRFIKGSRHSLEDRLKLSGVSLFRGKGAFSDPHSLTITNGSEQNEITFDHCIVATGSAPATYPGLRPDGKSVYSSAALLALQKAPQSLIIIGGGAIGLELGELFHRLGTDITLVEVMPRVLPSEEPEISAAVETYLQRAGWKIYTARTIASVATQEGTSVLEFTDGEKLTAEASLLAAGRQPATAALAVGKAGIDLTERGWLKTDSSLRCAGHIYAVGDVNGRTLLAHAADNQARYAVDHLLGNVTIPYSPGAIPSCVYGTFEIMRVGPTLAELQKEGGTVGVTQARMSENIIAQSSGHAQGFVRMLWKENILRSISAAGHGVSHLVSTATLLIHEKTEKNHDPPIIFAHPTLDEVFESAMVTPMENAQ